MPKLVDRDQQRLEVAWATYHAIASKGIERVTIHDVPPEAGRSTGMVTHYFADKESLLVAALTTATEECHERLLRRAMADPLNLRAVLRESLPSTRKFASSGRSGSTTGQRRLRAGGSGQSSDGTTARGTTSSRACSQPSEIVADSAREFSRQPRPTC